MIYPHEKLKCWDEGPLYLNNGEATNHLGWVDLKLQLHDVTCVTCFSSCDCSSSNLLGICHCFRFRLMHFSGLELFIQDQTFHLSSSASLGMENTVQFDGQLVARLIKVLQARDVQPNTECYLL